jgi:hypothetical protein
MNATPDEGECRCWAGVGELQNNSGQRTISSFYFRNPEGGNWLRGRQEKICRLERAFDSAGSAKKSRKAHGNSKKKELFAQQSERGADV